jgi:hypothetical protein
MAVHQHPWTLAQEAVEEYLTAARLCIEFTKGDGGVLGYPATLLLLCVVNALAVYLRNDVVTIGNTQAITKGEPFRVLNHPLLGQALSMQQIKRVEDAYRNRLVHQAQIQPGHGLTRAEASTPFEFHNHEIWISVPALYRAVSGAWDRFDKTRIKTAIEKLLA